MTDGSRSINGRDLNYILTIDQITKNASRIGFVRGQQDECFACLTLAAATEIDFFGME